MVRITDWLQRNQFLTSGLTLMVVGALMAMLRSLPMTLWAFVLRRLIISVEVPDRDPAFRWVQTWIAGHQYARRARNLSLTTVWENPDPTGDNEDESSPGRVSEARFLLSPAPGTHWMTYRGRFLVLQRARRDLQNGGVYAFQETMTLQVLCGGRDLVDDLLKEAQIMAMPKVPGVNILSARYDNWYVSSWRPKRPLGSIVLADGLLEEIIADMRGFLRSGNWYLLRGVPHRRGYLLHGPPGNGKTTLVAAAAGELGLSVALLSLNNKLMTDESLRTLVDALPAATILLVEDIDCAFAEKRAAGESTGVTMSGLLNALDGLSSREGRILFLTTNHPERLDPALVRPGRVDRSFHLGHTTPNQARRLFAWFYTDGEHGPGVELWSREFAARIPTDRVCMATIQEHLLRFRTDPEGAVHAIDFETIEERPRSEDLVPACSSSIGSEVIG